MNESQKEAFDAVKRINEEIYEKYGELGAFPVASVTFSDYIIGIDICNINIYNSEDEERDFYEKTNSYEPMYYFIKRKFEDIKKSLNNIEL